MVRIHVLSLLQIGTYYILQTERQSDLQKFANCKISPNYTHHQLYIVIMVNW